MPNPANPAPLVQLRALRFAYPGQPPVFDGLDLDLPPGLTRVDWALGKTTLLRLLAGALQGTGRFRLDGADWAPRGAPEVCWIDPRDTAWDALTPEALAQVVRARFPGFDDAVWQAQLDAFGLREHGHKTMHMLSTGSRRKVALACSLAAGAPLTLLDEPTAGLDRPATDALVAALAREAAAAAGGARRAWVLAAAWGLEDRLPWAAVLAD